MPLIAIALALSAPVDPPVTPAERLIAAKAAGFALRGGRILNECDRPVERLTVSRRDLNRDGVPEMILTDSSICYGQAGEMFAVLRKVGVAWTPVLRAHGIMTVLRTSRGGWLDIEIGGPGFERMPVARWAGTKYAY
jgi:hypothetical protein